MKRVAIDKILDVLIEAVKSYDVPVLDLIEVQTQDPFKVLMATILSARTKDETTAAVCPRLFKAAPNPKALGKLPVARIETLIYPVGFYKNKARYLKALPTVLEKEFEGKIPETVDELTKLPGVGRKTANLVSAVAFKQQAICVDVHVHRIMNRLGYIRTKTPTETEMTLRKKLPAKYWRVVNMVLVAFGQNLCRPISPHCDICPVFDKCNRIQAKPRKSRE